MAAVARLDGATRRDALLDAAAAMVAAGEIDEVSMELVAERAGVSRALVYKHFANRQDLLEHLFDRESALLHAALSTDVAAAESLADMLRALVRGAIAAQQRSGVMLAALGSSGARGRAQRGVQRRRDAGTLRFFARQAEAELGVDRALATETLAVGLGAISAVLARWRVDPTPAHAALLEDIYVSMVIGGLETLRGAQPAS